MKTQNTDRQFQWLPAVIALVQVLDIVIHVGNDMIEPIRILSNVFIFVWLGIVVSGRFNQNPWRVASGFLGVYLLLNAVFVATEGFINPENDQFRTVLFVLVGVTVALSVGLTNTIANRTG